MLQNGTLKNKICSAGHISREYVFTYLGHKEEEECITQHSGIVPLDGEQRTFGGDYGLNVASTYSVK